MPDEELIQCTEEKIASLPDFQPAAGWHENLRRRLE
jgi:hypothetical protein